MPPYLRLGSVPRKRHIAHTHQPGFQGEGIYYEEVVTVAGFSRAYSLVYHLRPPTRVVRVEPAGSLTVDLVDQPALRHHHLKTKTIPCQGDPISGRVVLLANEDVSLARCRPDRPQTELFRNADADELIFVHGGRGTLYTMFGPLTFREYDYIVIPRCTTYRIEFEPASLPDMLVIEASGNVTVPTRYLNPDGQLKLGSPYGERDLHGPCEISAIDSEQETSVLVAMEGVRLATSWQAIPSMSWVGTE